MAHKTHGLLAVAAAVGLTFGLALAQTDEQTVTGTVVSVDETNHTLVLSTDQGRRTFVMNSGFTLPADIDENDRVMVRYRNDGSNMTLSSISVTPSYGTTGTTTTTTTTTGSTYGTGTTGSAYDQDDATGSSADELPSTASPLALIALLGLGSLTGAVALRRRR